MSKQKDQKRKAQLNEKSKNESFKFQVEYARQQKGTFIAADAPELMVEVDAICRNGLVDALLALRDIVDGVRREFGIEPENERCSLNGAIVPWASPPFAPTARTPTCQVYFWASTLCRSWLPTITRCAIRWLTGRRHVSQV